MVADVLTGRVFTHRLTAHELASRGRRSTAVVGHVPCKPQIRASLVLDGDTLRVETNSERRMDRTLTSAGRQPPADQRDRPRPGDVADPDDPEMLAAVDEFIRDYEARWLDDSIPALHGLTPRQAADDPTRRDDLVKLMDSFPTSGRGMSAARLRSALGWD